MPNCLFPSMIDGHACDPEGISFSEFAGNFAALNQLLGLVRQVGVEKCVHISSAVQALPGLEEAN